MRNSRPFHTLEATAVLLFFVQAVRVLFSVLFGLIYDTIFTEKIPLTTMGPVMLCVVTALLSPLAAPRRNRRTVLLVAAIVTALARIPVTINQPTVRLWSSILVIAAAGVYTATLLRQRPRIFPTALVLAFAADQFLRAAGNTYDVSLRAWWLPVQVALSIATGVAAWLASSRSQAEETQAEEGIGVLGGMAVGALLFLEASLLGFPNALARWTSVDYAIVAPLLMAATLLPLMIGLSRERDQLFGRTLSSFALLAVTLFILAPGNQGSGLISALIGLLIQYPILVAFSCTIGMRARDRTGAALALGMLLFLLLTFALAFAFTYPYTIPAFREKGHHVFMVAAALVYLPTFRRKPTPPETPYPKLKAQSWLAAALVVLLTIAFARPPAFTPKEKGPIRVATYNIHYGYNTSWQLSLEEQARTIEESGADIVALQEADGCRITSYGVDDALWLARRLGMQEVYGPALEGLSGVALLTRFPIAQADTQLLASHLEQTAIVHARVQVGDQPLDAYGVWLGLEPEEQARQLDDALAYIGDASPAVFGGDFNATPDSPTYTRAQISGFADPFVGGGFDPAPTDPAIDPVERIDYVWMRGLEVQDARVLDSLASDHRMVVVELALP